MNIKKTYTTLLWIINKTNKIKWLVVILSIMQIFQAIATVVKALLLGYIVNYVMAGEKEKYIYMIYCFIGLVIFQIVAGIFYRFLNELTLSKLENNFKSSLLNVLLNGNYSIITHTHTGEWMNRLTSDTVIVAGTFVNIIPEFIGIFIRLLGMVMVIFFIEPKLLFLLSFGAIILIILVRIFRKVMKKFHKDVQEADGKLRAFIQERLSSLLIIKTYAQEKMTLILADMYMDKHKKTRINRINLLNLFYTGYSIGVNTIYIIGICFCIFGISNGMMSYGNLIVILQFLFQIQAPFASITGFMPRYYSMIASAERLIEVEKYEETKEDILINDIKNFYDNDICSIMFDKIAFTYPFVENDNIGGKEILKNVTFKINKGDQIVFTGPSGCGKSTLLKIMMGLYKINSGEVCILTNDKKYPLTSAYRRLFAYVPQDNQLLNGSIREIIAFNDEEKMKNENKIDFALKIACVDEFVHSLEKGIDTILGERGAGLSEGQMQRVAIARAIFSDHPILLLDEVTSSLDEKTANKILNNIRTMTDKTVILVTHNINNKKMFDKELSFSKENVSMIDYVKEEKI